MCELENIRRLQRQRPPPMYRERQERKRWWDGKAGGKAGLANANAGRRTAGRVRGTVCAAMQPPGYRTRQRCERQHRVRGEGRPYHVGCLALATGFYVSLISDSDSSDCAGNRKMFGRKAKKKGGRGEEEFTLNTSLATLQTLLGRNGHGPAKPPSSTSSTSTFSSSSVAVFSDPPSSRHSTVRTKASRKKGLRRAPLQDANAGRSANRPEPARKWVLCASFVFPKCGRPFRANPIAPTRSAPSPRRRHPISRL